MEASSKKRFIIIDGNAYMYRAFFAIRDLATSTGFPTNALFGFTNTLLKILREDKPDCMVVVFDTGAPTFRHKEFAEYKANRPGMPDPLAQQLPVVKELLEAFNIPVLEREGYEADDVIGTLAKKAETADMEVVIVTGDKDALQLVSQNVKIAPHGFRGMQKDDFVFDETEVRNRYGVSPDKITDLIGLMGDASDNIPGVPGIGEKTAAELIGQFGGIEDLLARVDEVKGEKRKELLKQYADQARLSKRLATIDTSVPVQVELESYDLELLPSGCPANCDRDKLMNLFKRLEFRKLMRELDLSPAQEKAAEVKYHTILSEPDLGDLVDKLGSSPEFAIDTETTSLDPITSDIVGISLAYQPYEAYYIPVSHRYMGAPRQLPLKLVLGKLKPILEDPEIGKIGQNVKYDFQVLKSHGVELAGISFDTMLASYLLNPSARGHDLATMAMEHLNHKVIPIEDLIGKGKTQITMDEVDVEKVSQYSCEDADITLQLKNLLDPRLKSHEVESVFREIELPLISVLADMEMAGVEIDTVWLKELSGRITKQLDDLTRKIYDLAGEEFNINSTQQLGEILFEKMKLPTGKKTKTGYSTNEAELERLSEAGYELPSRVLEYRGLSKLKSTYVDALPECINPGTGRVHTSFNQAVTETGRLSSSNPNLQNIPIRTDIGREIRRAFIPGEEGNLLLSADYSQIELRMLAHLSQDARLTEAFQKGEDIHSRTAALIFGLSSLDQITPDMRRRAKTINFGIIYGMGAFRLSKELGIPLSEAQQFIDSYFQTYAGVKAYFDRTLNFARENGYVTTISGRQRRIIEINSRDRVQREFAERTAINTPVQGSAADLIKLAMIKIANYLKSDGLKSKLLLQVHDELVFEVPESELDRVTSSVRSLMENAMPLDVPIKVDIGAGKNWLETK